MTITKRMMIVLCLAVSLSACDGSSSENNGDSLVVSTLENTQPNSPITVPNARQLDILDKIKRRSSDDGAQYQFDDLNPVFEQDGDTITVSFGFINPNTVGGTPVVEYSLAENMITSIVYTQ